MPLRRYVLKEWEVHPNIFLAFVIGLLLLNSLVGAIALYRTQEQQDKTADVVAQNRELIKQLTKETIQRSYTQCVTSNNARTSLRNVLEAAKMATLQNPDTTAAQRQQAVQFYDAQIDRIKITDCSTIKGEQ